MTSKSAFRFLVSCGLCVLLTGCGSDVVRLSEAPVPNPFSGSARFSPPVTGSLSNKAQTNNVTNGDVMATPAAPLSGGSIASAPLDSPSAPAASDLTLLKAKRSPVVAAQPTVVEPKKLASLAAEPSPVVVPQNARTVTASSSNGKWVAQGGSEVTLGDGDTIAVLSSRYGVPEEAIRGANGLTAKAKPARGAKLIIPVYVADGTLVPTKTKADAGTKTASLVPAVSPASGTTDPLLPKTTGKKSAVQEASTSKQVAALETTSGSAPDAAAESSKAAAADGFRWPARGRVILAFGDKNGVKSTGINISLPQGTPIKAAEAGTVAYAGSEIKGFGNLVMIRHLDGWVSVYGNNSEIKVKRGDEIKRGQVIALSGQSGDVSAPQLHFELRKGSVPVDPIEHLSDD